MALATFTPPSGDELKIGGSVDTNIPGPFPRYSISTETLRSDAVNLGQRFNITISGTAVVDSSASMLVKGERQGQINKLIGYITSNQGHAGTLVISAYGGANSITFNECVLVSMDAPEQDDVSQGVQTQEYTFTFEAYEINALGGSESTSVKYGVGLETKIQDYSESWSCSLIEGQQTLLPGTGPITDAPNEPMYQISQNISAVGKVLSDGNSSYLNAKAFVDNRLTTVGDDPLATFQDEARTPQNIDIEFNPAGYTAYNHIYSYDKDIQGGSYSVTRNWIASKQKASLTMEFTNNIDTNAEANTVGVNFAVTGLDTTQGGTEAGAGNTNNKYANAVAFLSDTNLLSSIPVFAVNMYQGSETLNSTPVSTSRTDNKSDGVITFTYTFDDKEISVDFPCATNQTVNINDSNTDGLNQIVAILAVIAKSDGPVIQDMRTTNEKTRSVSLDLQIKKEDNCRDTKPDGISWIVTNYPPSSDTYYRTNASDSWSPSTGAYSATVDFVWI